FDPPLVEGRLIRRYKRFLADVRVGRDTVVAHCPNPGSMRTCADEGGRVWLQRKPATKLGWSWELAEIGGHGGALVSVNTARGNQLVAAALAAGAIAELREYETIEREVAVGDSRLDFHLSRAGARRNRDRAWVEVKTATMDGGHGAAAFPDAVTVRGARHLEELRALRRRGFRATLLFVVPRTGVTSVRPADEIDPRYGITLRRAAAAGVEILAYTVEPSLTGLHIGRRVAVAL
ncbi:MAG TPA: DNA/RNA nuclease SfsA, partial [Kofleriaceae bacterium]|nr:DNA/RNA nuclease SfsA [Kofleriaceae bacterium]